MCRITLKGDRYIFATGQFVNPESWNSKKQIVKSNSSDSEQINKYLALIKHNLNEACLSLSISNKEFTVNEVYQLYSGENKVADKATLLQVFEEHNMKMKKLLGKEYALSTWEKYEEVKSKVKTFVKAKYKKNDYLLSNLNMSFLNDFIFYLKTDLSLKQITINKTIQRVKKIVKLAITEGLLDRDPFMAYKPSKVDINVVFLTSEELEQVENHIFSQRRLAEVRDCFVFCCYTNLSQ